MLFRTGSYKAKKECHYWQNRQGCPSFFMWHQEGSLQVSAVWIQVTSDIESAFIYFFSHHEFFFWELHNILYPYPLPIFSLSCCLLSTDFFQFLYMKVKPFFFPLKKDKHKKTTDQFKFHLLLIFNKLLTKQKPARHQSRKYTVVQPKKQRLAPCQEKYQFNCVLIGQRLQTV